MEQDWPLDRALAVADRAIGVPVLTELCYQTRATAVTMNLPELWQRLGVSLAENTVTFDDAAPLAATQRALTARSREQASVVH